MDSSGLIKGSNKKGILLISTLFFIIVLIMMSVALFALTRANYADMRSFYSENEAITNAESAINIASFIIASNSVLLTINSSEESNPTYEESNPTDSVNLGTLINNDNTNIIKRINANNYRIVIVNLRDGTIRSNDNTNINININNNTSQDMAAMIISPRNKSISDSGAILFFGNSTSTTNTYNTQSANAVAVSFENNQINFYFNNNGNNYPAGLSNSYPLYTSVNNVNNNSDITNINGYRNANEYTLLLMAMGYSRVPNTNRYVVRYVDQKLANGGLLSASAYANGTMDIKAKNVFSIADKVQYNKLIAENFSLTLRDNDNQTLFKLTNGQDSNRNGYLVAKRDSGNKFKFNGTAYNSVTELLRDDRETQVKDSIKADVLVNDRNVDTSKLRDSLATLVQSKFNDSSNYVTLPAGYYIFVDSKKIVYFPPTMEINTIQTVLEGISGNLSDGINYFNGKQIIPQGNNASPFKGLSGINIDKYQLIVDKNIKIDTTNAGGNKLFFVSSFGKVKKDDTFEYFGNRNVQIVLGGGDSNQGDSNQSVIMYGQDVAVTIDGVVKGQGTFAILNSNPSSPSTVSNSFAVDYTNSTYNAFYPYRYDSTRGWVDYNNQAISTLQNFQTGSMVIRFDQVKSSEDRLALLVDNDLYINPLDFSYVNQNLDWFDHILAYKLQEWARENITIKNKEWMVTNENEKNTAIQYLFDHRKWDFDKIWKDANNEFRIHNNYKAIVDDNNASTKLLSYEVLASDYGINIQGNLSLSSNGSYVREGWLSPEVPDNDAGNPDSTLASHKLTITININSYTYTIELQEQKQTTDPNKSNLTLNIYDSGGVVLSTYNLTDVERNAALGLLDSIDGTSRGNRLTLGKLAWIMTAFTKSDPSIIKDVTTEIDHFNIENLRYKSKDFAEDRLEGLYKDYQNFLINKRWNNELSITPNPHPNTNYFPFLSVDANLLGDNPREEGFTGGAINNWAQSGSRSILESYSFSEKDVKLEGMIFVGNKLNARTGTNNNLVFQGNLIVGNTDVTHSGNVTIKGVKDTIFHFDLDNIDLNLLSGTFIRLVPLLYKQESVISK